MCIMWLVCSFFCFKQKTAYEMRISDWSSDVCSSDLGYTHTEHLVRTPGGKTGLFIASRQKLTVAQFRPFAVGRMPHSLWHLDWMASKGIARWVVDRKSVV